MTALARFLLCTAPSPSQSQYPANISPAQRRRMGLAVHFKQGRPRFGAWYRIDSVSEGVGFFACGVRYCPNV